MIKIAVLSDNRTEHSHFETEHGLCVYLESDAYKFLLDTGASDIFLRNAQKLNIDISDIDYVFISHGHADHTGGLAAFLKVNSKAKIILSAKIATTEYYSARLGLRKISIDYDFNKLNDRFIFVHDQLIINDSILICKNEVNNYQQPFANKNLYSKTPNEKSLHPDDFSHELILVLGNKNVFVYTGCAHNGLLNILETVKKRYSQPAKWILGGFHLIDYKEEAANENKDNLQNIAYRIGSDYPESYFITGHCTGDNAYKMLKKELKTQLDYFYAGFEAELYV